MLVDVRRPGPPLGGLISQLILFSGYRPPHQREKILPDGAIQLIVDLTDRPKRLFDSEFSPQSRSFRRAWISGMQSAPITIEAQQMASFLIVAFRPGGIRPVLGFAAESLNSLVEPFEDVLGGAATQLRERLLHAGSARQKLDQAEAWLRERVLKNGPAPAVVAHLSSRSFSGFEQVRVLAEELGYSERQMRNIFREWIGLGPKTFLQVQRFQAVIRHLAVAPEEAWDWSDIAPRFGYADQSHLHADFRRFAGMTPARYAQKFAARQNFLPIHMPEEVPPPLPISSIQAQPLAL